MLSREGSYNLEDAAFDPPNMYCTVLYVWHSSDGMVGLFLFSHYPLYLCTLSTAWLQGLAASKKKKKVSTNTSG